MVVSVKKIRDTALLPTRGSKNAAGYDLYADISEQWDIMPHEARLIPTGLALALPEGYFGGIFARSGLASKEGLRPANCTGVIDADYRGEIMVSLHNDSEKIRTIEPLQRIAQLVVLPYLKIQFCEDMELTETERGSDGFGSTGKL